MLQAEPVGRYSGVAERGEMKERPIIFSGPMVRAILEGRKTQTRRTGGLRDFNMVGLDGAGHHTCPDEYALVHFDGKQADFSRFAVNIGGINVSVIYHATNPYGLMGDRLWVRETWYRERLSESDRVIYRAHADYMPVLWKPSISMPRWASRLLLEITEVKVQRLQDISFESVQAEGLNPLRDCPGIQSPLVEARQLYATLWDSLNIKRGYGWAANPWVWAISFKAIAPAQQEGK